MRLTTLILSTFLFGCGSSKITRYTAIPKLVSGEKILFYVNPNSYNIKTYDLFLSAEKKLKDNTLLFYPEYEYSLINKGLEKTIFHDLKDNQMIKNALLVLGCRYYLQVDLLRTKDGSSIGFYTENEIGSIEYSNNSETNIANLRFTILDSKNHISKYQFVVFSSITPLTINERDGDETRINVTNSSASVYKAFNKGMSELKKRTIKAIN